MSNCIPTAHVEALFPGVADSLALTVSSALFSFGIDEMPVLHPHEQLVLAAITRRLAPHAIVEFGTARGQTTLLFAANSPDDTTITTVDLEPSQWSEYSRRCLRGDRFVGEHYRRSPYAAKIRQVLRPRPDQDPPGLLALEPKAGFLLMDGDHSYRGVRHDTETAFKLAHENALFAWHDFYMFPDYVAQGKEHRGVFPYLNELARAGTLTLYHVAGTYLVVGQRAWPEHIPSVLHQPGDRAGLFRERIVRLGDT